MLIKELRTRKKSIKKTITELNTKIESIEERYALWELDSTIYKKFKNKYEDTDVLTFVTQTSNKNIGKYIYCDIFFSIDTIEEYIKNKKITLYDHYNHLLIHSILHINGYDHKNLIQFNKMKKEEIKTMNKFGLKDPYIN